MFSTAFLYLDLLHHSPGAPGDQHRLPGPEHVRWGLDLKDNNISIPATKVIFHLLICVYKCLIS